MPLEEQLLEAQNTIAALQSENTELNASNQALITELAQYKNAAEVAVPITEEGRQAINNTGACHGLPLTWRYSETRDAQNNLVTTQASAHCSICLNTYQRQTQIYTL